MNVTINGSGYADLQPPLTLILRGQGLRIKAAERERYDTLMAAGKVHITWQKKAWADDAWCLAWAEEHWPRIIDQYRTVLGLDESEQTIKLLLVDGLSGQVTDAYFAEMWQNSHTKVHVSPAGCTDGVQPVDHGVGKEIKRVAFDIYLDKWLEDDDNRRRWTAPPGSGGLEAWELRVLFVNLLVQAWDVVKQKRVTGTPLSFIARSFVATGMMVGVKGYFADRCTTLLGDAYKKKNKGEQYETLKMPAPRDTETDDDASVDGATLGDYRRRVFGDEEDDDGGEAADDENVDFEEDAEDDTAAPEEAGDRRQDAAELAALREARRRAEQAARERDDNAPVPPVGWCVRHVLDDEPPINAGTVASGNAELIGKQLLVLCKGATRRAASVWRQGTIARLAGDLDRSRAANLQANYMIKWTDGGPDAAHYLQGSEHGKVWVLLEKSVSLDGAIERVVRDRAQEANKPVDGGEDDDDDEGDEEGEQGGGGEEEKEECDLGVGTGTKRKRSEAKAADEPQPKERRGKEADAANSNTGGRAAVAEPQRQHPMQIGNNYSGGVNVTNNHNIGVYHHQHISIAGAAICDSQCECVMGFGQSSARRGVPCRCVGRASRPQCDILCACHARKEEGARCTHD